jgi:hypothetical protein
VKTIAQLDDRDGHNLLDAIFSYLVENINLIYLTCREEQWLVDTYRIGRLVLTTMVHVDAM